MNKLKITLIQSDLVWENREENLKNFSDKISQAEEKVDIIILPEMFTTGFSMQSKKFAEPMNDVSMNWMHQKAKEKQSSIVGSLIIEEDKNYYNRHIWMKPDGKYQFYDKRHLFRMSGEHEHFTPGNKRQIVEFKGWKFLLITCYDLRFPVWCRNTEKYDAMVCVANWPEVRKHAWTTLLQARAIENQAYAIGVNRIGKDNRNTKFSGNSVVFDPKGNKLTKSMENEEYIESTEISLNELNDFRKSFPVDLDADKFEIS
ncbi:MAG: amidohydrolase [Bacteroidetes bacterium]|jgi:omega-amidase|nr:amidohydrolase [Bacteroidota bacterium]MBT6687925.1 amidohydrolase [Bacteroidota bacterium]MBT7143264.1 amidohydrolase [Bacteroidota bacterium]MBT7490245.1 amidohydrolase [Bacteroidota bacterium]